MNKTILFSLISAAALSMSAAHAGGGSLFGGTSGGYSSGSSYSSSSSMSGGSMVDNLYVGGSLGQSTSTCMLGKIAEDCDTDGWKVFGGYKFTDNIAAEAGYYNIGSAEETVNDPTFGTINASAEATGIGLTGVYSHELIGGLDVFGKAGVMLWNLEGKAQSVAATAVEEEDGTSFLYGLGANYQVTDNIGVRGEWERYTAEYKNSAGYSQSNESDVDILSAGVTFSTY